MLSTAAEVCLDAAAGQDGRRAPEDGQDGRPLPEDGLEGRSHPRMAATSPRMVTLRSRMVPLCALMPLVRSKATLISSTEH